MLALFLTLLVGAGARLARGESGLPEHEAPLGAGRHDDRVFDHLRLHQTENLGSEIFAPIRPPQPAAGNVATTQMNALDLG